MDLCLKCEFFGISKALITNRCSNLPQNRSFTEHPIFTKPKRGTIYIQVRGGLNLIFSFPYGSEILPDLPSKGSYFPTARKHIYSIDQGRLRIIIKDG